MGVIIPVGYGQANHLWQLAGGVELFETTHGFDANGLVSTADQLAQTIRSAFSGTGRPFHPSKYSIEWVYRGVRVTVMSATGPLIGESLVSDAGTINPAATLPPNSAFLVRKRTGLGGRAGRGRMYLPPAFATEAQVTSAGVITSTVITDMTTTFEAARADLDTSGPPVVLLHSSPLLDPTEVTSFVPQSLIATQRRRLRP